MSAESLGGAKRAGPNQARDDGPPTIFDAYGRVDEEGKLQLRALAPPSFRCLRIASASAAFKSPEITLAWCI